MAWPKKHTRRIHINDCEYLWHVSGNEVYNENPITVGTESGKFVLFINPYAHDWEITPSNVRAAIEWALSKVGPQRPEEVDVWDFHQEKRLLLDS